MMHGKRTLVTGGRGFLGSHITESLLTAGADVTIFDRNPSGNCPQQSGVHYIVGNLSDYALVDDVLAEGFDVIIHLASSTTPRSSNLNPTFDVASNGAATVNLIECASRASIGNFVFLSSGGAVYGDINHDRLINEDDAASPISSYGIVKLMIEHYLRMYHQLHGLPYVALRVANPFGHRQIPNSGLGAITTFVDRALRGETIEIWGDGSVIRDFIFVTDVARAVVAAASGSAVGVFNVGSGEGNTLKQIIANIGDLLGELPEVSYRPSRVFDPKGVVLDCARIRNTYGWAPQVPLLEGMSLTLNWLREQMLEETPARVVNL